MAEQTPQGAFCWNELMTTDVEGSKAFYTKLFGWKVSALPMGEMGTYHMFKAGDTDVGGMMQLPEEALKQGAPPHWLSYVHVEDVDACAKRAAELGAKIRVPPTDIPSFGRFAVMTDPLGAVIALFKGSGK